MNRGSAEPPPTTLAVVDMGSNSFRLELGRIEGDADWDTPEGLALMRAAMS